MCCFAPYRKLMSSLIYSVDVSSVNSPSSFHNPGGWESLSEGGGRQLLKAAPEILSLGRGRKFAGFRGKPRSALGKLPS